MNFTLRRPRLSDLDSFARNIIDPAIENAFMSNPKNRTQAKKELQEKIADNRKASEDIYFVIIDNEVAGEVSLSNIIKGHKAKLSFWLGKPFRHKGIMTQALKRYLPEVFKKYKLVRIYAFVRAFNTSSSRLLERMNFRLEGTLRKNKLKDGKYLDDLVFAKLE